MFVSGALWMATMRGQIRQDSMQRPLSAVYPSSESSHQRRWSVDSTKPTSSAVIIVKKTKKEPEPPQRSVSLLRPQTGSHCSTKRHSCPTSGILSSLSQCHSSSSSISSCSSPTPVQTSMITGPDPLGWKVRHKFVDTSSRARTARLSLQIPLPAVFPEVKSCPSSISSDPSGAKASKQSRRRYSDSSAFLQSLEAPLPVLTIKELSDVQLRSTKRTSDSDDVFCDGKADKIKPTKTPPPVPVKTPMARQIAQLIAFSQQLSVGANDEPIYIKVLKS